MPYHFTAFHKVFLKKKTFLNFDFWKKHPAISHNIFENIKILSHQEMPDVRREEVQHSHHHLGQHVHVQANSRHAAVSCKKNIFICRLIQLLSLFLCEPDDSHEVVAGEDEGEGEVVPES